MTRMKQFVPIRRWPLVMIATVGLACLSGCFEEKKTPVKYTAYNETDRGIVSIVVNGEGGILNAYPRGGGGSMCCVVIPNKWKPGLNVTIKWQEAGDFKRDPQGHVVKVDGVPVVIEMPWIEKTVEIAKYDDDLGHVNIHFFPNNEVKVVVSMYDWGHPDYPMPVPGHSDRTVDGKNPK